MIRINLLPHREVRRRRQILQHLMAAVGVIVLAMVVSAGVHVFYTGILSGLQAEEVRLIAENQKLKRQIGKIARLEKLRKQVQAKLDAIEKLQKGRFRSLGTLVAFSQGIPENVWLSEIRDEDGQISISGYGESNRAVARFMRALQDSSIFANVKLEVIERKRQDHVSIRRFDMVLKRVDNKIPVRTGKKDRT